MRQPDGDGERAATVEDVTAGAVQGRHSARRAGLVSELLLAVPPTLTVLAALWLTETLIHRRVVFAALAASAFLIYRDPKHQMNDVRVMVTAHLCGAALGLGAELLLGPSYPAGAVAMVATILTLIVLDAVHPPAIATSLGFAILPSQGGVLGVFLLALALVAVLVVLQRLALRTLRSVERRT
jgi:CBS-domain-containing membrane protein